MSLKKKAISGIFWTFFQQFSIQGINFFVSLFLARLILPSEFGLIAMISVLISIGNTLINSGMSQSLLRTSNPNDDDFSTVFYFNVVVSIFVYIAIWIFAPFIADFFNQVRLILIIRIYSLTFIINSLSTIQIIKLTLKFDFKSQAKIGIPSVITGAIVGLSLAYYNYGVWSLVWSSLTQSFISTCQYWYISKWIPLKKFNRDAIKKHWQFGYKLLISGLLDSLFTNAYTVTIGKYLNPAQVGYFQRADTLKQFPVNNISAIISKVSFPLLSSIQNDDQKLKYIYKQILETIIFFVAPLLIILGVLAEPLINFLFTDRWSNSIPFFQILCFSGILYPIQVYNLDLLNVKGRSDLFLKLEIVKTISIAIIIYISLKWGITGLLYSTIVSSIFSLYVNSYFTSKLINYNFFNQISDLFPTFMISIFAGFIVLNFDKIPLIHDYNDSIRLLAGLIIGIITYISLAFIFKLNALLHIKNIFLK